MICLELILIAKAISKCDLFIYKQGLVGKIRVMVFN